jgi:hypothetical protein
MPQSQDVWAETSSKKYTLEKRQITHSSDKSTNSGVEPKAVFTGLIQALGTIRPLGSDRFDVSCREDASDAILRDLAIGDSVAVDGICLTVEEILPQGFVATASDETLYRTTLGQNELAAAYVNLETSVRVGSKLGGHLSPVTLMALVTYKNPYKHQTLGRCALRSPPLNLTCGSAKLPAISSPKAALPSTA